ncbi:unnamed protein product [Rotaria sordida]|uniref:EF-hand domain-containing protein n=1 Tax=Rotaria sordida TaxID=392033 RepID=A0A815MD15_9BILA|nr:unnamed protein product [Rotaria sordida]
MGNRFVLKSKTLTDEEIADLEKVTNFDADSIKDRYKNFLKSHPSGKMNKKQFLEIYDQINRNFGIPGEMTCENVFAAFDKNKDEALDFKEFLLALVFLRPNTIEANVDSFFKWHDVSGDGCLDYQELKESFESVIYLLGKKADPKTAEQMASDVFAMLGLEDDSKITKEQFIKGWME